MIGYIWSHAPPWYSYILCLGAHAPKQQTQKNFVNFLSTRRKVGFFHSSSKTNALKMPHYVAFHQDLHRL